MLLTPSENIRLNPDDKRAYIEALAVEVLAKRADEGCEIPHLCQLLYPSGEYLGTWLAVDAPISTLVGQLVGTTRRYLFIDDAWVATWYNTTQEIYIKLEQKLRDHDYKVQCIRYTRLNNVFLQDIAGEMDIGPWD